MPLRVLAVGKVLWYIAVMFGRASACHSHLPPFGHRQNSTKKISTPRTALRQAKRKPFGAKIDLTRGRTWNLLIADWIVVKRLAIGPLGQLL